MLIWNNIIKDTDIALTTKYSSDSYTPGLFWSTVDDNPSQPKAGIWLKQNGSGTDVFYPDVHLGYYYRKQTSGLVLRINLLFRYTWKEVYGGLDPNGGYYVDDKRTIRPRLGLAIGKNF